MSFRDGRELAAQVGRFAVWFPQFGQASTSEVVEAALEVEELGYGRHLGGRARPGRKEPLSLAAVVLAATSRISVATTIVSV